MRAIDGDALEERFQSLAYDDWNQGVTTSWANAYRECADMVYEQPTIEPEPKKGKWIWSDEDASWKCGNCDCVFEEIDWKPEYNFCPNCGARLEEAE